MKRIALLAPRDTVLVSGPQGGSSVILLEDRSILERGGWEVQVFGPIASHGVPVRTLPVGTFTRRLSSLEYCGRFVRQNPATVLLAYNEPTVAVLAPLRTIVRYDWHTPLPRYWRTWFALHRFRRSLYLFPSKASRAQWGSEHPDIPAERSRVIANGVDLDLFHPLARNGNGWRVGFAGQWIWDKGLHVLLRSWQEVKTRVPRAELWVAGGPDLWQGTHPVPESRMQVVTELRNTNVNGLKLVGVLPRAQMPAFWAEIDIACFPSVGGEAFGLAALEAMACGVPVITSDSGALPELVGKAGVVVPRCDEKALADELVELMVSPERLEQLSVQSRLRAEAFSLVRRGKELLDLVEQVAATALSPEHVVA